MKKICVFLGLLVSGSCLATVLPPCAGYQVENGDQPVKETFGKFAEWNFFYNPARNPALFQDEGTSDLDKAWFTRVCQPELVIIPGDKSWTEFVKSTRKAPAKLRVVGSLFRQLLLAEQSVFTILFRDFGFVGTEKYKLALFDGYSWDEKAYQTSIGKPLKDSWSDVEYHYLKVLDRLGYSDGDPGVKEFSCRTEKIFHSLHRGEISISRIDQLSDVIYMNVPATRETFRRLSGVNKRILEFKDIQEVRTLQFADFVRFPEPDRQVQFKIKRNHYNQYLSFGTKIAGGDEFPVQALPMLFLADIEKSIRSSLAKMRGEDKRSLLALYDSSLAAMGLGQFSQDEWQDSMDPMRRHFLGLIRGFLETSIQDDDQSNGLDRMPMISKWKAN